MISVSGLHGLKCLVTLVLPRCVSYTVSSVWLETV